MRMEITLVWARCAHACVQPIMLRDSHVAYMQHCIHVHRFIDMVHINNKNAFRYAGTMS